jgi:hypothetical protein
MSKSRWGRGSRKGEMTLNYATHPNFKQRKKTIHFTWVWFCEDLMRER